MKYTYDFDPQEPNNTAAAIFRRALEGGHRVLDLGSGPGIVSLALAHDHGRDVTCLDADPAAIEHIEEVGGVRAAIRDLSDPSWFEGLDEDPFDVIILADVLEHLVDPAVLLRSIKDAQVLSESGRLVVSFPNAAHESIIDELLKGRFTYQETGLLDSTHLRFFTLDTMRWLLESEGFSVEAVDRIHRTLEQTSLYRDDPALAAPTRSELKHINPELSVYQYVLTVLPASPREDPANHLRDGIVDFASLVESATRKAEEAAGRANELDAERAELAVRNAEIEANNLALQAESASLSRALEESELRNGVVANRLDTAEKALDALSDAAADLELERQVRSDEQRQFERLVRESLAETKAAKARVSAATSKSKSEIRKLKTENRKLERELGHVYRSNTWRVGRWFWRLGTLPSRLFRRSDQPTSKQKATPAKVDGTNGPRPESTGGPQRLDYVLTRDVRLEEEYVRAAEKLSFADPASSQNVVMAVYTTDFAEGRGDLYVAVGLGRYLERIGYEVIYRSRDAWYDLPGTSIVIGMLETINPEQLANDIVKIGWVRNSVDEWASHPWLNSFDHMMASSKDAVDLVQDGYIGDVSLVPIGVDLELFRDRPVGADRRGAVFTQNQWGRERTAFRYLRVSPPESPVTIFGIRRGLSEDLIPLSHGSVSFFELPSLYAQAKAVPDDFNHVTAPFGCVNSRIYEAAASGALVMTSQEHGLPELGLEDIVVYNSPDELADLLREATETDEFDGRRRNVHDVVVRDHSFERRAEQVAGILETVTSNSVRSVNETPEKESLAFFPDYRDNPYQEMLYSAVRSEGIAVPSPAIDTLDFGPMLRLGQRSNLVFHLNWTAPILAPAGSPASRISRYRDFVAGLDALIDAQIPIIWTLHNLMPHEAKDSQMEARLRHDIAQRATLIHIMNPKTVELTTGLYELPADKVRHIPHPSYVGVYPNLIDPSLARSRLGIARSSLSFLFLGGIRPYKGLEQLLDAFDVLSQRRQDVTLAVAGKPGRFPGVDELEARCLANPRIVSRFESVPPDQIQLWMNAADVVVLPHEQSLNAGSLHLAYGFGRPVVASSAAVHPSEANEQCTILFDWDPRGENLVEAMAQADRLATDPAQQAAFSLGETHDMIAVAAEFRSMVDEARRIVATRSAH